MKTLNRKRFITLSAIAAGFISLFSFCFGSWTFIQDRDVGFGFQNSNAQPVAYLSSNKDVKYSSLDKAVKVAKGLANFQTPQTVIVIPNSTIEISTLTIPSYVTVFVPLSSTESVEKITDEKNSMYGFYPISDNTVRLNDFADSSSSTSNRETVLKIKNNLLISENAELVVDGVLGSAGSGLSGQTTGKYSEIQLFPSAVLKNSGLFDCRGYVKTVEANGIYTREDNGSVCQNLSNGRVYAPFVIDDYGGGSHTVGSYLAGGVCPFSGIEMPNIQSSFVINASSKLYGWADLYTNAMKNSFLDLPATHNRCAPLVIASNDAIINLGTSGKITCKYTPKEAGKTINDWSTGRKYATDGSELPFSKYSFVLSGGASSGSLNMIVAVGKGQVPISTSDVLFPVSWKYDISLENGDYVFDTQMKFLPGSSLAINNANLKINSGCVFYNADMDDKKEGGNFPYAKSQKAAKFLAKDSAVTINNSFGGFVDGEANRESSLIIYSTSLTYTVTEGKGDFITDKFEVAKRIGVSGAAAILEFLKGNKTYSDIADKVKKLAVYNELFSDKVETRGYIGSKTDIKNFEINKYAFSNNNQFWSISAKFLHNITIQEKDGNYSSGKKQAATFNIVATFNPSNFDELVVSFEWKQKRQDTGVSEDGTFVNYKLEGTTFNTVANKNVLYDNKIDVWLEITLKGREAPVVSNTLTFNARNYM